MNVLRRFFTKEAEDPVNALVRSYIKRIRNGEQLDRSDFISEHPDIAVELRNALDRVAPMLASEQRIVHAFQVGPTASVNATSSSDSAYALAEGESYLKGIKFGDYEIESEIGQGAMGRVYKAWQSSHQRYVALKTLHSDEQSNEARLKRLNREGLAQSKLSHPNIIEIYDIGIHENIPYLAMEYVEDGTLQSLLRNKEKPFSARESATIIRDLANALAYSHEQGVLHRDIKPSNILMAGNTPKLTDFGLAFVNDANLTRLTQSGEMLGTICYMAPENAGGLDDQYQQPQPQSDVYSLGATLYELLTGMPPFHAFTVAKLIKQVIEDDPRPPVDYGIELNKDIEAICVKCLEKSPEKRYQRVSELADDLNRFLNGEAVRANRVNWFVRKIISSFRHRRVVLFATVLALSAVLLGIRLQIHFNYRNQLSLLRDSEGFPPMTGKDYTIPFLLKVLDRADFETRMCAITALCRKTDDAAVEALIALADDPDQKIRFHLTSSLTGINHPAANPVCQKLLQEKGGYLAVAAIRLAEGLADPVLIKSIRKFTFSNEKILCKYAIIVTLNVLGRENEEFVQFYLQSGPKDGRLELLRQFLESKSPPPIHLLIDRLGTPDISDEEKDTIAATLAFYTDQDFGDADDRWRDWYERAGRDWRTHRASVISWSPPRSKLEIGDIIWTIDDAEPVPDWHSSLSHSSMIKVIRKTQLFHMTGIIDRHKSRVIYVGMIGEQAVGNHALTPSINTALGLNAAQHEE